MHAYFKVAEQNITLLILLLLKKPDMFDILFGWRKASKCKKLIKQVQCRLKLLKSKRHSIVRQLRDDVAQLIKIGYEDIAFKRAEHLFKDEMTVSVYELLESFCDFIVSNLSYIRRHKDCPNDINEAVSSLIFASARCGDLPELRAIRKLFGDRYGQRFSVTALELLPGNLVNLQIKEKLSTNLIPDDVKRKLVDEIARDYCLRPEILVIEYTSEPRQQVKKQNAEDTEGKAKYVDGASAHTSQVLPSNDHQQDDIISKSVSSAVEHSSSDVLESPVYISSGLHLSSKSEIPALGTKGTSSKTSAYANFRTPDQDGEGKRAASSSESLPQLPEEMIVYLDDVMEVQHSIQKEGSSQEQSIFRFKSSVMPKTKKGKDLCKDSESCSDCSSSSSARKRFQAAKNRMRRRCLSTENSSVKDTHCEIYYKKPHKRSATRRSHLHCKHQRRNSVHSNDPSYHGEKRQKQPKSCLCFNPEAESCCLNNPCFHCCKCFRTNGESNTETDWNSFPPRPTRRSCNFSDTMYNSFSCTDFKPDKQSKTIEGNHPLTTEVTKHRYLRAMTMPQERTKNNALRYSKSFPDPFPNHVHPKLPDYDEIAAKFLALKKEHLQNKNY